MSQPLTWFPLAGCDPVPGDPVAVRVAGDRYVQVAETIDSTASQLRRLTEADGTISQVVSAIREKAQTVADDISRAQGRYDGVGHALRDYAVALDAAQAESEAALREAQATQQRVDAATAGVSRAERRLDELTTDEADDAARTRYRSQLSRARGERDDAEIALAAARTRLDAAITDRDRAAETAIDVIEGGMSGDGLEDSFWENLSDVAESVSNIAGAVAAVAGVASLLLGWVPILGQALAAVAVIAGAVALLADIVLMLAGEGSWTDIIMGVVGLATFGVGRLATTAVRMGATGARGAARLAAGSAAALSPASRASRGLSGARNALGAIDDMAGAVGTMTRGQARLLAAFTSRVDSLRDLTRLAGDLHPSTVLRTIGNDLADLRNLRFSDFGRGWAQVGSANGATATIATLLGNGQAGFELSAVNRVAPELLQFSDEYARSVSVADNLVAGSAGIAGYTVGFPPDWYRWEVGTGAQVAEGIAEHAADTKTTREVVRRGVLGLDEPCVKEAAAVLVAALWLPDRVTGGTAAMARLELLVNSGVPVFDRHVRFAQAAKAPRGMKVFERLVRTMDLPAGRALAVITTLAERSEETFSHGRKPNLVETRLDVTVFPPGSSDTLCLHAMTVDQAITEALGEHVRAIVDSLTVTVGEVDGS